MFVAEDGAPLHLDYLTPRFHHLVGESGLPPVRLHDLPHGAASLAHCAGAALKTVQAQLGHGSIVQTADTYTSVLTGLLAYPAEATAKLVLAAAARNPGRRHRRGDHRQIRWPGRIGKIRTAHDQAFQPPQGREARPPTYVPQRSRAHSRIAIRAGNAWCTA
jgi:hypothetical protein